MSWPLSSRSDKALTVSPNAEAVEKDRGGFRSQYKLSGECIYRLILDLTLNYSSQTLEGGSDSREFDGPALAQYIHQLAAETHAQLRELLRSPQDHVLRTVTSNLVRRALSLDFLLHQQHPSLATSQLSFIYCVHRDKHSEREQPRTTAFSVSSRRPRLLE